MDFPLAKVLLATDGSKDATRAAVAVLTSPSVASNIFSGKPFMFRPRSSFSSSLYRAMRSGAAPGGARHVRGRASARRVFAPP
jgi:hypothetical protein